MSIQSGGEMSTPIPVLPFAVIRRMPAVTLAGVLRVVEQISRQPDADGVVDAALNGLRREQHHGNEGHRPGGKEGMAPARRSGMLPAGRQGCPVRTA